MKKTRIMLAALLLTGVFNISFAAPAPYVDYLYNDVNYPIVGGRQGVGKYVDLTSLYVIKNDQFGVEFRVNVLSVNHDRENSEPIIWGTFHYFKKYSEPNSMFYVGSSKDDYSPTSWQCLDLNNHVGTVEVFNRTFITCMEHITGDQYRY